MKNIIMKKIEYGSNDYEKTVDLRNEYFRKPQGLNIRDEDLSGDKDVNMYAGFIKDEMMATVFYLPYSEDTAQVKAVIVAENYRQEGLGKFLMDFIEDIILREGFKKVRLMGRVSVEGFYKKLGYRTTSEIFDYYGTPHLYMEKTLRD